jgi:hypothetical protein
LVAASFFDHGGRDAGVPLVVTPTALICGAGVAYAEREDLLIRDALALHGRDDIRAAVVDFINE